MNKVISILTILALILAACGAPNKPRPTPTNPPPTSTNPPPTPTSTFPNMIYLLSLQKSKAEDCVRKVNRDRGAIGEDRYRYAQGLYGDAQRYFNAWINGMQTGLGSGNHFDEDKQLLGVALQKSHIFYEYVDFGYPPTPTPSGGRSMQSNPALAVAAVLLPLVGDLSDAAIEAIKEYNRVKEAERQSMIHKLEEQKWKPFDEIR